MTANEDGAPVTGQDPGRVLLDKIGAREQALARQAEQARAQMADGSDAARKRPSSTTGTSGRACTGSSSRHFSTTSTAARYS